MKENWENNWEDYYQILGIPQTSDDKSIKKAYLYKVQILHTDRMINLPDSVKQQAEQELKKVNYAYDVLKNPPKRREYDEEWLIRKLKINSSEVQDENSPYDIGKESSPSPQPETTPNVTPDVTNTETQALNSRIGTKQRKVKRLPIFAAVLAIVIIVLGIVFLHFNKSSNANQSRAYTVGLPAITLTYPNGGETWHLGDKVTIRWTSTNISEDTAVNVSLSLASTQPYTPSVIIKIGSTTNTGSFTWTVTGDQFITTYGTGDYAKVVVETMGTSGESAKGFTITQ
jgi:hypothetical protein